MSTLWQRAADGLHSAYIGGDVPADPAGSDVAVIRVDCSRTPGPLAPVQAARRHVLEHLGLPTGPLRQDEASASGVRRHLLGEPGLTATVAADLTHALFMLGEGTENRCAVVFNNVEDADRSSLEVLRGLVSAQTASPVPLVLGFRERPRSPFGQALLTDLLAVTGPAGVLEVAPGPMEAMEPHVPDLAALPRGVRRVLRAAAWLGMVFDASEVARVLRTDSLVVLECLQEAVDAGVPLLDEGRGAFRLPGALVEHLRAETIPSLADAWNQRRAELHAPIGRAPARGGAGASALRATSAEAPSAPDPGPAMVAPSGAHRPPETESDVGRLDFGPEPAPGLHESAAEALAAAGDYEEAARRLLMASRDALALAAFHEAMDDARQGLHLLRALPMSAPRRRLRVELLAELGRIQWLGADERLSLTLPGALETLDEALSWVRQGDAAEIEAAARSMVADVCYELGDHRSLERALLELRRASELLQADGQAMAAARLINDQAAVYVRIGDPLRANRLLSQSRQVFEDLAATDEVAQLELAETDHLIARLPLHVPARPGRGDDAWSLARDHASKAEACYVALGLHRDAARVWETLGRIEVSRGQPDQGVEWFQRALGAQQAMGDLTGLARTTEGLARAFGVLGAFDDALTLLEDSTRLNLEKGSPVGLAYDKRALAFLESHMGAPDQRRLKKRIAEVGARITDAAARLGVAVHDEE